MLTKISQWFGLQKSASNQASVTLLGSGNHITQIINAQGASRPLPLMPVHFVEESQRGGGVAAHLEWRTRLASFTGRQTELKALQSWLDESYALSFKIIHAEGGVGKTRLAAEFAVLPEVAAHWQSGWVDLSQLESADRLHCVGQTVLLVDYPEHNPRRIAALAKAALAGAPAAAGRVRVLLLCREAASLSAALQDAGAGAYFAPPMALQPLASTENFEAFVSGLKKRGFVLDGQTGLEQSFALWLARHPLHGSPLFVNALALDVADTKRRPDGSDWLAGVDLLRALLARESKRWNGAERGAGVPQGTVRDILFWATVLGGLAPGAVNEMLARTSPVGAGQTAQVHQALAAVGVAAQGEIAPLQPDLLATVFLTDWLQAPAHQSPAAHDAAMLSIGLPGSRYVAKLLRINMLAYDQTVRLDLVKPSDLGALDRWLLGLCAASGSLHAACQQALAGAQVWRGLPGLTRQLTLDTLAQVAAGAADTNDERQQAERARTLSGAAIDLSQTGDRAGALEPAREAVC